jgi:ribosome-associated translation inhibitor RaiA
METANICNTNESQVIAAQDLPDAITGMIKQQIARLKQEYNYILNCKVAVAMPAFCHIGIYQVRMVITLPNLDLKIDRDPTPDYYQEDIYVAIWSAFDLARKKLKEHSCSLDHNIVASPLQPIQHQPIRGIRRSRGYAQG